MVVAGALVLDRYGFQTSEFRYALSAASITYGRAKSNSNVQITKIVEGYGKSRFKLQGHPTSGGKIV